MLDKTKTAWEIPAPGNPIQPRECGNEDPNSSKEQVDVRAKTPSTWSWVSTTKDFVKRHSGKLACVGGILTAVYFRENLFQPIEIKPEVTPKVIHKPVMGSVPTAPKVVEVVNVDTSEIMPVPVKNPRAPNSTVPMNFPDDPVTQPIEGSPEEAPQTNERAMMIWNSTVPSQSAVSFHLSAHLDLISRDPSIVPTGIDREDVARV